MLAGERFFARDPRDRVEREVAVAEEVEVGVAREVRVAGDHQAPSPPTGPVAPVADLCHDEDGRGPGRVAGGGRRLLAPARTRGVALRPRAWGRPRDRLRLDARHL